MSSSLSLVRNDRRGLHGEQMGMTPEGHSEVKVSGMSEVDSALDVMATVGAYFQSKSSFLTCSCCPYNLIQSPLEDTWTLFH